ncbi:hypothetical protein [Pseudodesulfovibrio sp.]|uniref:hypothetical protein n=1 Tax=unclassified Pseudodesulfovibrio TaxID=2661612 RepID=UPI003AFFE35B
MDIDITRATTTPPTPYANTLSMVIRSFKGRRNVEVHLFRASWSPEDEQAQDWDTLISPSPAPDDPSRRVVMEAFSDEERDHLINYLKEQYSTRLTALRSRPLAFPVPTGMAGLSQAQPDKDLGFIEFTRIPSYPLEIPLKGLYDLSRHPPLVDEE